MPTPDQHLAHRERAAARPAEVARQHQHRRNLHELGGLELAEAGDADPRALAVNLEPDAGNEHDDEQEEAEGVEERRDVDELTVVGEGHRQHHERRDAEADELLLPVALIRLRVIDHPRPEQGDGQRQQRQNPVEIAEFTLFQYRNHFGE